VIKIAKAIKMLAMTMEIGVDMGVSPAKRLRGRRARGRRYTQGSVWRGFFQDDFFKSPAAVAGQFEQHSAAEAVGIELAGLSQLNDLHDDHFGHGVICVASELERIAHFAKRRMHRLDVLGIDDMF
jgi:hypothetical protein